MCGRYTLRTPAKEIAEVFGLSDVPDLQPRFNIAPTQDVAAVRLNDRDQREFALFRWGLIPFWADDPKFGNRTINARAETVATKPAFRAAFKKRRCLVVADGFYEWQKADGKKQPFLMHMKDDRPFAFAGLWEQWKTDGKAIESCTIIVTEANALLAPIHDRMPVILPPAACSLWLDPEFGDRKTLEGMLRPYAGDDLEANRVSMLVNNPRNDVEACVKRLD